MPQYFNAKKTETRDLCFLFYILLEIKLIER
ncbi:Uncharacterised protein [Lysinibacillus sphaericus]|nr:Uncharacterised protein [Lysinibacillus sphaericus]